MIEQVVLVVAPGDAELASSDLWDVGASAVGEVVVADGVELVASFGDQAATDAAIRALADRWSPMRRSVADDGLDAWRAHARAVEVAPGVIVRPAWVPYASVGDELVIDLEPGRAFGVGDHPTTRLALRSLLAVLRPGDAVLDVGCGSGVLSVAAALRGAGRVVAIDIDDHAVAVTTENATRNGVASIVAASTAPIASVATGFDIVVANLGGAELPIALAPHLRAHAAAATLIVSGMLDHQTAAVRDALGGEGRASTEAGWSCLTVVRRVRPASCTG